MATHAASRTHKTPALERFQNWFALIGAGAFAFFVHPFAYAGSVGFVTEFGAAHYGALVWAIPVAWWLLTFAGMLAASFVALRVITTGGVMSAIRRFV